jgi:hypothetical protein
VKRTTLFFAAVFALGIGTASAQTVISIQVTPVSLATTKDNTQVAYLTFDMPLVEIPREMRLSEAYVEFYMDATSTLSAKGVGNTVTLEVYPFKGATNGKLDVSTLGSSSMKRTVRVGADRRIRLYVTDFVQQVIANPNADRRLIVGSIAGDRTARFDAKAVPGASGSKALLTVYFSRIEDTSTGQTATN